MQNRFVRYGAFLTSLLLAGQLWAQGYTLTDLQYLPGDAAAQMAVRIQAGSRIAAGGPGYLVVWEDQRTVIASYLTWPNYPLMGNLQDIYAARLDANGNLLDASPIIISNASFNQTKADVAWNGQNWLVVWETLRSDWYFYHDILGVRVSPEGVVLDSIPINIRLENSSPSGDAGFSPSVTSDGVNWVVTWEDMAWHSGYSYPNAVGARIAPDGTILDNPAIVLYQGTTPGTYGPIDPQMRWAGDEFLLVWEHSGYFQILGKRFNSSLQPIDVNPFGIASNYAYSPRLASNGTDFCVVSHDRFAYRVNHNGTVLDPNGIEFGFGGETDRGPDVAWDGTYWVTGYGGVNSFTWKMYLTRISASGIVQPPGSTQVGFGADDQFNAALASQGGGSVITAWDQRSASLISSENVHAVRVDANWNLSPDRDVSVGWHRQINVRLATNGSEHMAVFQSQGGGLNRICTQRVDQTGNPLDPEPVVLGTTSEGYTAISTSAPDIAFNGSVYLAVWTFNGSVYGRRLQPNGTPIEGAPVTILTDNASSAAVAAIGDTFYLAYTYTYSGNQQALKGVRLNAANLSLIGSPAVIGVTGYDLNPVVRAFGNRWLVVWESQITHDNIFSTIRGRFIETNGTVGTAFAISTSGDADNPDVAIGNNRAFVVWNEYTSQDGRIRARLMNQDGSFVAGQFLVNDAANRQFYPTAAWDGNQYATAWVDNRSLSGVVEQLRGDIYAARVSFAGTVLDPNGIQLTSGPLPEDLPAAAAANGKTLLAFSKLHGAVNPEIQRIGYRVLENTAGSGVDITMTPTAPPIQIPAVGGSFNFDVAIHNGAATQVTFDGWIMQIQPNGVPQGPMIGPVNLTLAPSFTLVRNRNQNVPGTALPGVYTYIGYVGIYATSTKWDSSFFNYTKLSSGDGALVGNWENWGESFDAWTSGTLPEVSAGEARFAPTRFNLLGAYPNPFNPTTALSYQLAASSFVSLKVYDTVGRLVADLVNGWREAGSHRVTFDGSNLSSGVYLYRLEAGEFTASGKMVLMK